MWLSWRKAVATTLPFIRSFNSIVRDASKVLAPSQQWTSVAPGTNGSIWLVSPELFCGLCEVIAVSCHGMAGQPFSILLSIQLRLLNHEISTDFEMGCGKTQCIGWSICLMDQAFSSHYGCRDNKDLPQLALAQPYGSKCERLIARSAHAKYHRLNSVTDTLEVSDRRQWP
ncbi:hypothetical protein N7510_011722 [Penicillium lagena]|uniref:uncharacterized protein n=1 Tax=Penicillium lagena TaxID=94218 RepID=UPI002541993F|nr:uncharacterized protein N7510_011722 [Penicillium lagena]KAJ5602188.1 hypothetical protein N7510_011722 [Penicillium lagena]